MKLYAETAIIDNEKIEGDIEEVGEIARDTRQYFWFESEGTDTGAHISEKPREEFLEDPERGGGNLLARSNGIAIRDGLTELATFASNGIQIDKAELFYDSATGQQSIASRRAVLMGHDEFDSSEEASVWATNDSVLTNNDSPIADAQVGTSIFYSPTQSIMHAQAQMLADLTASSGKKAQILATSTISNYSGTRSLVSLITLVADMIRIMSGNTAVAPIVKQTFSATGISSNTFYHVHTFNIAKTGYTPIAVNVRINQAAIYCSSIDYTNQSATTVSVAHRSNNAISNLNLYLEVTYARNELL